MFAKRSQVLKNIQSTLKANGCEIPDSASESVLKMIEIFMEPKLRPLTTKEIEDHILVQQVHESRKDEVREYVKNLDYELKREFVPEQD
jgi:hypothetical protein